MIFTHNSVNYTLPDQLADVELQKHVLWSEEWGWSYRQKLRELQAISNPIEHTLQDSLLNIERYCRILAFYTGISMDEVRSNVPVADLFDAVGNSALQAQTDEITVAHQPSYSWIDESSTTQLWTLYLPADTHDPYTMAMEEYAAVCKLAQTVIDFGSGSWQDMMPVFASYFRINGEPFDITYLDPNSARYEHLKTMPLDMAFDLAQYLFANLVSFSLVIDEYILVNL